MPRTPIARRSFLQTLAASTAGILPFTGDLVPTGKSADGPPKRLVLFMQNNGTQQSNFWPTSGFSSPILAPLLSNAKIAAKTNLIKGVYVPNDANGTDGNQHDMGFARMFTGARLASIAGHPWGGGASADQILADAWGLDSLTLAILASQTEPHPKPGFNHRRSFCYRGAGIHKLPTVDPYVAYQELFPKTSADGSIDEATRRRLLLRKSVLDSVNGNLKELQGRLGAQERAKLDLHVSAVRQIEKQLSDTLTKAAAVCGAAPKSAPLNYGLTNPNLLVNTDEAITDLVDNMIDLAGVSLICGLRRIATVQFGYGGGKWRFGWEGINMNCHDDVAHLDTSDAGSDSDTTARIVKMNHYYASRVARMATMLEAIPEGAGTMLDNTLIVWANELGRGDHTLNNVPIVLIGKAGGAIPTGGRVIDKGKQVFNRLGCTILNVMGQSAAGFGNEPACGSFDGLL